LKLGRPKDSPASLLLDPTAEGRRSRAVAKGRIGGWRTEAEPRTCPIAEARFREVGRGRGVLWEPRADQFPDHSRQRPGRSSGRLVERDRLFERDYTLLLRIVFRREGCEHGFDAGLPLAVG
jgi:hypothetical protein